VREQISLAIRNSIKEKHPLKTEKEVSNALELIKTNHSMMEKWLWVKTVSKLYSNEEKDNMIQRLKELIAPKGGDDQNDEMHQTKLFSPKK